MANPRSLKPRDRREELIQSQLWKCNEIAKKISLYSGLPFDELRDAARESLVKIYNTWDGGEKSNFSTWVNRCLHFTMMNYLRDSSRLVKIPRSYSDYYLKIRKLEKKYPQMSPEEIGQNIGISGDKVKAIQTAFKIRINNTVEEVEVSDYNALGSSFDVDVSLMGTFPEYKTMLIRLSELPLIEEQFLVDHLVKKRSAKTLIKKYSQLESPEDIKTYAQELIDKIVHAPEESYA